MSSKKPQESPEQDTAESQDRLFGKDAKVREKRTFQRAFDNKDKTLYFNASPRLLDAVSRATEAGIINADDAISDAIVKICEKSSEPQPPAEPAETRREIMESEFEQMLFQYLPLGVIESFKQIDKPLPELIAEIGINWLSYQPCNLEGIAFKGKKATEPYTRNNAKK